MNVRILSLFAVAAFLVPAAHAAAVVTATDSLPTPESRRLLFNRGDMSSAFWRIPALAATADGVVIAAADRRNASNKDLPGNIDIVVRRSFDSGDTWTDPLVVMACDSIGGYGDAAVGIHRPSGDVVIVAAHGNGVWESTADCHTRIAVTRSSDNGATWSLPVDITPQLFSPVAGEAPVQAISGFASSGTMLCDADGTLAFLLVTRHGQKKWGPLSLYLCTSTDGGYNWNINTTPIDTDADESKIAQLADGSYYISIRNRHKGARKTSQAQKLAGPWSEPALQPALIDPACNADLIAITPAQLKAAGIEPAAYPDGLMVHSIANDALTRRNVSILMSADLGKTWRKVFTVDPFPSGYSAVTLLPDGNLGCLAEESAIEGGYRLWFTHINLAECLNNFQ